MTAEPMGRENVYVCQTCGGYTVTVDRDEGVTPFMIGCRASGRERECSGQAHSSFYPQGPRPPHIPPPAWEWYRATDAEARRMDAKWPGSWQHHENGGLFLRRIEETRQQRRRRLRESEKRAKREVSRG